jgi:hypothetical protein
VLTSLGQTETALCSAAVVLDETQRAEAAAREGPSLSAVQLLFELCRTVTVHHAPLAAQDARNGSGASAALLDAVLHTLSALADVKIGDSTGDSDLIQPHCIELALVILEACVSLAKRALLTIKVLMSSLPQSEHAVARACVVSLLRLASNIDDTADSRLEDILLGLATVTPFYTNAFRCSASTPQDLHPNIGAVLCRGYSSNTYAVFSTAIAATRAILVSCAAVAVDYIALVLPAVIAAVHASLAQPDGADRIVPLLPLLTTVLGTLTDSEQRRVFVLLSVPTLTAALSHVKGAAQLQLAQALVAIASSDKPVFAQVRPVTGPSAHRALHSVVPRAYEC